jgi:molybdopterin converting factor small subunit
MAPAPAKCTPGQFTLLYFAAASSYTKKTSENLPAPLPVARLFATLEERYPGIGKKVLDCCAVTVNLEYIDMDDGGESSGDIIKEGDEVAIIPPVSSG